MGTAPFISWVGHGAVSLAPSGVFTGVTGHAFVFRADRGAMQSLADRFLNAATGGKVRYQTFTRRSMVTFTDMERCTSDTDQIGWVPGRETALWVPLLEHGDGLPRFVLWAPYIFISYPIGMATGREIWGWPKDCARIDVPAAAAQGTPPFTCSTTMFPVMAPDTQGQYGALYSVVGKAPRPGAPVFRNAAEAGDRIVADLLHELAPEVSAAWRLRPSAVALKQFRDVADSSLACYSAVCDSPLQVTRFGAAGLLDANDYNLEITTCESHQIVRDFLGRDPDPKKTVLPIEWALWSKIDFKALPGRVIAP